jgi:serine-type anaerobic sulfatase-maturating enzyme
MTGTYRRVLNSLAAFESKLSPTDQAALHLLLPPNLLESAGAEVEFWFKAPQELLTPAERQFFLQLCSSDGVDHNQLPALRSSTVLIMKATRLCNLRCNYCHAWREGPNQVMGFEVLAKTTRDILRQPNVNRVNFVWHGGEVTLLPIEFFRKALWLQRKFRNERQEITNSIQTNATCLCDDWVRFFVSANFEVGVSIDGPPEIHDLRRRTAGGRPTWNQVQAGISRLLEAGIKCGVLVVVDRQIVELGAARLLNCLVDLGVPSAAILNVIPDNAGQHTSDANYLPWPEYVRFLTEMFREWWPRHRDRIEIRELAALVNNLSGKSPALCVFAGDCMGQFLTIEPNGDVRACDKYVGDHEFEFGNVLKSDLNSIMADSRNLDRARMLTRSEVSRMSDCRYSPYCHGGCPHDRRLNYLNLKMWDGRCCGLADLLDEICATKHNIQV